MGSLKQSLVLSGWKMILLSHSVAFILMIATTGAQETSCGDGGTCEFNCPRENVIDGACPFLQECCWSSPFTQRCGDEWRGICENLLIPCKLINGDCPVAQQCCEDREHKGKKVVDDICEKCSFCKTESDCETGCSKCSECSSRNDEVCRLCRKGEGVEKCTERCEKGCRICKKLKSCNKEE